jgi:formamidopyrimidine-DNA glycosylase
MPELPEVETTRRGLLPLVVGRTVSRVLVRVPRLRWPIPADLSALLVGRTIVAIERRAKYLLLQCDTGAIIVHLGMSGHLRLVVAGSRPEKHDHIDLEFTEGNCLRLHDPRRFGAFLWTAADPLHHPLLCNLGPEPLAGGMDGDYLHRRSRKRRGAVKPFIMDQGVVVGVGNIYASEALFRAGIHPAREAGKIGPKRYRRLARAIEEVLEEAIAAGGTTLRDFAHADGKPGYFALQLQVYGRGASPCPVCEQPVGVMRLGGRSTFFCGRCQK